MSRTASREAVTPTGHEPGRFVLWSPEPPGEMTLLVADSDPQYLDGMLGYAPSRRFRVEAASCGTDALALARRDRPSVILMGPGLPDMPGLRLLDLLRHDVTTCDIPVIVVGDEKLEREAMRRGAYDFVRRPVHLEKLVAYLASRASSMKATERLERVLVVDDDPACRELALAVLEEHGYAVEAAGDAAAAFERADRTAPDLIVMDVMMPGEDGIQALERLKTDHRLRRVPVIFMTALGGIADKLRALKAGGDDYLVKPFDGRELAARVELTLRKVRERESVSPNTLLPGTHGIEMELRRRNAMADAYAFCYVDIDNFKSFNDNYGYVRADAVIKQLGGILSEATCAHGRGDEFLGHIAGDDFVLVAGPADVEPIVSQTLSEFDAIVPFHYDPVDRQKGYIVAEDRYGTLRRFPLMTLSAVALRQNPEPTCDYVRISDEAAALKKRAKKIARSVLLKDW